MSKDAIEQAKRQASIKKSKQASRVTASDLRILWLGH